MAEAISEIVQKILGIFNQFFTWVIGFLPRSPFRQFINAIGTIPYLAELNWFFPVSECIAVLEVWLTAVVIYYLYSVIMRTVNMIR